MDKKNNDNANNDNNIACVVMNNSTKAFDKAYHYLIPQDLKGVVRLGIRVIVPFGSGNGSKAGFVIDVVATSDFSNLKQIKDIVDGAPIVRADLLPIIPWMKEKYMCTHFDALRCMFPSGMGVKSLKIVKLRAFDNSLKGNCKKIIDILSENNNEMEFEELKEKSGIKSLIKYINILEKSNTVEIFEEFLSRVKEKFVRVAYIARPREEIIYEIENNRIDKIHYIRVLEMLLDNDYISISDITRFSGVSPGVLDTLKKRGYIDFKEVEVSRDPLAFREFETTYNLKPTCEQEEAINQINAKLDTGEFHEVLLHGVTGSGKTEVYLQLIGNCIKAGKQAIVLVPEISLTPQMVERFKGRFGDDVAVLHSRLSLGERYDQWRLIRNGKIKVTVGARSAVFAPHERLGMIVIDEEHETTYKSETTPKYHARDIARKRCEINNAVLLYGSATPSVETYHRAKNSEIGFLQLVDRTNKMDMPSVNIVDMREELATGNRSVFSEKLLNEIRLNIQNKQQTMLFLNKRGYASFVLCRGCGYSSKCENCNVSMTYHMKDERLICHYCGFTVKKPEICPTCKSKYIKDFGTGTQKIEEEIKKYFKDASIIRMDLDTTTHKNSHEEILNEFKDKKIDIMVGTQMIAKGHDFPNVTLVGVLAADSLLNSCDYKSSERTFQLLTQVAGRAGRGKLKGRVVIQTYNTEDYSIKAACGHNYTSFFEQEIKIRKKLNYSPFTNIAVLILSGINDRFTFDTIVGIKRNIKAKFKSDESVDILGPARAPISKIKNKFRWRLIIKYADLDRIISVLDKVSDEFHGGKYKNSIELSIDINPVNML